MNRDQHAVTAAIALTTMVCSLFLGIWIGNTNTNTKWELEMVARGLGRFETNATVYTTYQTNVTTNVIAILHTNNTRKFVWK